MRWFGCTVVTMLVALTALAPRPARADGPAGGRPRVLHLNGHLQHALRVHSKVARVRDGEARRVGGSWVTGARLDSVSRCDRTTQVAHAGGELGGGGSGLDGELAMGISHGWALLAGAHAPLLRAAGSLALQSNRDYLFSSLRFPGTELGYQYSERDWLFEIAADGSLVVDGRYRIVQPLAAGGM